MAVDMGFTTKLLRKNGYKRLVLQNTLHNSTYYFSIMMTLV